MSLFEYLGVLISVVMGLGMAHLLTGISRLIQDRATLNVSVIHILWTVNMMLFIMAIWWGMFYWSRLENWSFFNFLFITLYATTLYLLTAVLYPRSFPVDFDFEAYFLDNRRWFFGIMLFAWLMDLTETNAKADGNLRALPDFYFYFLGGVMSICVAGGLFRNKTLHIVLALLWMVSLLSIVALTQVGQIADPVLR